jgi:MFS family permease
MKKFVLYPWVVVALLWFVALLNYLDRLMITSMRDPIKESIAMTDAQFGLLTAVFLWVYGTLSPLGGFFADRFSRSRVILISLVVWSAVTWLTGHVRTFPELLTARAIMGISEACYIPAALALIADYHRGRTRSLATGLHMSGVYAGAALGGIGGYLAEHASWRFGFTLFGAVGVGYAVILLFLLRDPKDHATVAPEVVNPAEPGETAAPAINVRNAIAALFSQPAFWVLIAINALVGIANWGINGWLPTYLREKFSLGLGEAGLSATAYIQIASFAGVLIGGAWADSWSRSNRQSRSLVPAIGYCVAAPCLFLAASVNFLPWAIAGLIMYGLGRGFFDANNMPILRQVADERFSATGYGILNFVSCMAGGVMIYVGGLLKDLQVSLSSVFQASAISLFFVGLLLFFVKARNPRASIPG